MEDARDGENSVNWDLILKLGIGLVTLVTATVVAIHKIREAKAQKAGLAANPERCLKHEERMSIIEEKALGVLSTANMHFSGIEKQLGSIGDDVKTLLKIHLEK